MAHLCKFCNKQLSTQYSLKRHQQNTKACLDIQKKKPDKLYICECNKEFNRKDNYKIHKEKCKTIIVNEMSKSNDIYRKDIMNIIDKLISVKSNTTNNNIKTINIVNNLIPLDPEYLKQQSKFLTLDYINDGPAGYAKFVTEYMLKDRVICSDVSRKTLMYKGMNNKQIVDVKGIKVSKKIGTALVDENSRICKEQKVKLNKELEDNYENASEKLNKCHNSYIQLKKMSDGKETKFSNKFIDHVCSRLKSTDD